MNIRTILLSALAACGTAFAEDHRTWDNDPNGVQVFILAGQSNMVGHGKADDGHGDVKGAIGSLRYQVDHDPKNYGHLVNPDGTWKIRDDVKVWWRDSDINAPRAVIKGDLKIGYSQSRNPGWIGPEYGFGWTIGDRIKQPVHRLGRQKPQRRFPSARCRSNPRRRGGALLQSLDRLHP